MRLFENNFQQPIADESVFIERAESNVDVLAGDLEKKNWTEIWDSLCHSELNDPVITAKMSPEYQEKFKSLIAETREVFNAEREGVNKDLVEDIEKALDKISEKF